MVFYVVVLLKYNFSLRNMSFIEEFARLRLRYVSCRNQAKRSYSFYTTVVNDGLHGPYLLLANSTFILILSDSHWGCLIWVKFVEIPKQKFESQLNIINPFSILSVIWKLYHKWKKNTFLAGHSGLT